MHAIIVLMILGLTLGFLLGLAAKKFKVESDPLVDELADMLPGTNCGQCGLAGCPAAAEALAVGEIEVTFCPPGGKSLAEALAEKLNVDIDLSGMDDDGPKLARVDEEYCIGCFKCSKVCPTDAIVGAPKQIHVVMWEACTGCGKCVDVCPTECMQMFGLEPTLREWRWPKPPLEAEPAKAAA